MSLAAHTRGSHLSGVRKRSFLSSVRRVAPAYAFLLPGFVLFSLVMLYPTVSALITSLKTGSFVPGAPTQFVGFSNYSRALHDGVFWRGLANSGVYMIATVVGQMVLGLMCALLLDKAITGRAAFRAMIYIPVISSWVIVSILFKYLFQEDGGTVNWILGLAGAQPVAWFSGRWPAMTVICALGIWKGVGWTMLVFLAALQAVPVELHEAAQVDGAGAAARLWNITLPAIRRTTFFISIMLIIGAFNVFISVTLILPEATIQNYVPFPFVYLYQQAFNFLDFGYGSAIAFLLTGIIFIISIVQFSIGEKVSDGSVA